MADEVLPANWTDASTGLACAIVRGPLGALNGYVAVPPSHPWFRRAYNDRLCDHGEDCWDHRIDERIAVHGGLTYSGAGVRGCRTCHGEGLTGRRDQWGFGIPCPSCKGTGEAPPKPRPPLSAEPSPNAARQGEDSTEGDEA